MHDSSERRLCRECRHAYAKIIRNMPQYIVIIKQIAYKQVRLTQRLERAPKYPVSSLPINVRALDLIDRIHEQTGCVLGQIDSSYTRLPLNAALMKLEQNVRRIPLLPSADLDLKEWRAIMQEYDAITTPR